MRVRLLVAAAALAAAPLLPSFPVGASDVPDRPADKVLDCVDGTGAKAEVWEYDGESSAIRNGCDDKWLVQIYRGADIFGEDMTKSVSFAPGVEVTFSGSDATHGTNYEMRLGEPETCAPAGSWVHLVGTGNDQQTSVECDKPVHEDVEEYRSETRERHLRNRPW